MKSTALVLLGLLATLSSVCANVVPSPLFQDHAVLQHGKPVPIWGTADAGESVSVTFAGQTLTTTARADGSWRVSLAPLAPDARPGTLTLVGKNTVVIRDVLVGEVWLASGQSNMEWPLKQTQDANAAIASADLPLIRELRVGRRIADTPLATFSGAWQVASPATAGEFSAVGYYFALELHRRLGQIPVGIIHSSWGGTYVEVWLDRAALASEPALLAAIDRRSAGIDAGVPDVTAKFAAANAAWETARGAALAKGEAFTQARPKTPWALERPYHPACLYNGMIHPLLPYALRGAIWYQGESNVQRTGEYRALFSAMITQWRAAFAQGDFPLYWVQLAAYNDGRPLGTDWAFLREAQTQTLALPQTGQAVIIDGTEHKTIHPTQKAVVGERLARLALARTYGLKGVVDSGPRFERAVFTGATARVEFAPSPVEAGDLEAEGGVLAGFELAGADRIFQPAEARIEGRTVVVTASVVPKPIAVRYAWRNAPAATLRNAAGLPAAPFRSDDFPAQKDANP
ncbi:MAG: sialate O-acetylesterase [Burkholderiales bacterium]|nr:sialate O-acetylesterase [Opitutaceae bacterium]